MNRQRIGLFVGVALFCLVAFVPIPGLPEPARLMLAVAILMASWWVSEAIPLAATALLPLVLFPSLGLASAAKTAAPYANHLIFLFMGGFMLAQAMQRWNLHRRIALSIVGRIGTNPKRLILGFMCATAFVSMWVSNTATTVMMMPIGMAVTKQVADAISERNLGIDVTPGRFHFGIDLMLGIAYAASIGGVGTLIGTPPNVLLAGILEDSYGIELSFLGWMAFGVPFVALFLPLAWLWLTRFAYPLELPELPGGRQLIGEQLEALGPMGDGERKTAVVFVLTAAAWMFRPIWTKWLPSGELITDSTIAIAGALLLFLLPTGSKDRVLDWHWASRIPWEVLVLFGGGFALAQGFEISGLAQWLGNLLVSLRDAPLPVFVIAIVLLLVILTEFASNTASAAMALPILGAAAVAAGLSPMTLCVPAAAAASCAFMMPAATPPNAIVFGTGYFTIPQMVRAGAVVNLMAVVLISLFTLVLLPLVVGS